MIWWGKSQGILFSVCDCSHCVFSKHIRPKSFFKTHIQQTKTKQTYITNTYSKRQLNSKSDEELCVILALIPLCYPRPEPPSQECWTLGCTSGIRVGCWLWYLGASWAAKTKQTFLLPRKPHFFFIVIITTCCRMSRKVLRLQRLIIIII